MNSRRELSFICVLCSLLGLLAIGCSPQSATKPDDKLSDPNATAQEKSSGEVKQSGSLTGEPAAQAGIKDNTPSEPIAAAAFPRPENAEQPMYTSETNTLLFHQPGNVDAQAKFYTDQLGLLGWTKEPTSEIADGVAFLDFTKGSLSITVTINPLRDGMITTIAQGNGLSVDESLDESDDDSGDGNGADTDNDGLGEPDPGDGGDGN